MLRFKTLFTAACLLLLGSAGRFGLRPVVPANAGAAAEVRCVACHAGAGGVLKGPMATRSREAAFARRALGSESERFFAESCGGCHVTSCADCHGLGPNRQAKPANEACLRCHRGYSAGWEFEGRAPREEHARYRRGAVSQGEPFLLMLPDVHHERGMVCADCHTMKSLQEGKRSAKGCRDCHAPGVDTSPAHDAAGPMGKVACAACHAGWEAQEYGTFLVKAETAAEKEAFAPLPSLGTWKKSAHLKRQDSPPLGVDAGGLVAPIRPQFILFATDPRRGWENRLLAAEWRPAAPHTIRRGTVGCDGCHGNRRRFLLEKDEERLYPLEKDGLSLRSYWNRTGQRMNTGAFLATERFERMNAKSAEYCRLLVKRWQTFLAPAAPRSKR